MKKEYIQKAKEEYEFITFDCFKEEIKFKNKYINEEYERDEEYEGNVENDIRNFYGDLYDEAKGEVIRSIVSSLGNYFYDKGNTSSENEALWLIVKYILDSQGFDECGYRDFTKECDEEMFYKTIEYLCKVLMIVDFKTFQEIKDGDY